MGYGHYLVRVQTTYHFRYTLPTWAIGNPTPIQLKRSLAIHDAKIAKKLSRHLASQLELFLATINLGLAGMNQFERKRVLFRFLEQQIQEWKSAHAHGPRLTREQLQERVKAAQTSRQEILWDIQSSNLTPSLVKVGKLYQQVGVSHEADKNDAYDFAQTEALFHQYVETILLGNFEMAERLIERNRPAEPSPAVLGTEQAKPDEPLISTLIQEYLEENKESWARKTYVCYSSDLNLFLNSIEDKPINKYSKQDFSLFREKLKNDPKYSRDGNSVRTARRSNNIIGNIATFLSWCNVTKDVIDVNVAHRKSLPTPKSERASGRERWSKEELEIIFTHQRFTNPDRKKPYNFWVPILGYYSGMRLGEICLLRKDDIYKTDDGIWAISLNEKYRTLKNKSSVREIPIHDDVIELGFVEYVASCKDPWIFKTTSEFDRHDDAIGKSFGRFKTKLGFGSSKVFHCFRNTFIDESYQQGMNKELYKDFVGHSQNDITHDVYANKASVRRLKEEFLDLMKFSVRGMKK